MAVDLTELQAVADKLSQQDQLKLLRALEQILVEHETDLLLALGQLQGLDQQVRQIVGAVLVEISRSFRSELQEQIEQLQKAKRRQVLRQEE